eukprot:TRINITY_DN10036_c0_g1_i3.p1 TRINITY_DN10036_c0_g1~~TRINITY_DN10036_c0_g1_i3.p1  ORF type:complete len:619 (+),score=131.22 TRINITY_DN10036_c0_g1_i3:101-1858(+)
MDELAAIRSRLDDLVVSQGDILYALTGGRSLPDSPKKDEKSSLVEPPNWPPGQRLVSSALIPQSNWRAGIFEQLRDLGISPAVDEPLPAAKEEKAVVVDETAAVAKEEKAVDPPAQKRLSKKQTLAEQIATRRARRLKTALSTAEKAEAEAEYRRLHRNGLNKTKRWFRIMLENFERVLDVLMAWVIIANAAFIGFALDFRQPGEVGWLIADMTFSFTYCVELLIKLCLHGFREHFLGKDRMSNMLDAVIIGADSIQVVSLVFEDGFAAQANRGVGSASLLRVVRLLRVARILRLIRTNVFADLLAMVQGMYNGFPTLGWACVIFFLIIYVAALVCRDVLGNSDVTNVKEYFNDMTRAIFTVFRCSFGDCTTNSGTPIPYFIKEAYGDMYSLAYTAFTFFITIGLFNIISAIFVDSTMSAAASLAFKKHQERLSNFDLWSSAVHIILRRLLELNPHHFEMRGLNLSENMSGLLTVEFTREEIEAAIQDGAIEEALKELDIEPQDNRFLHDILDPDHNGNIGVLELINGLQRLRGAPRRSDVVTVDLMVRSMQEKIDELLFKVDRISGDARLALSESKSSLLSAEC